MSGRGFELLENIESADIDRVDKMGSILLHYACGINSPRAVQEILATPKLAGRGDDEHPEGWGPVETVLGSLNGSETTRAECGRILLESKFVPRNSVVEDFHPNYYHWLKVSSSVPVTLSKEPTTEGRSRAFLFMSP